MSTAVVRTADAWWVQVGDRVRRVETQAVTTAELLADRAAVDAAADSDAPGVPLADLALVSPVTAPCRVVAQMTNYVSHVRDSGMDPDTIPLTFFRKASGSIAGPTDDVVKPPHVLLLDYEVEIGLVIGEKVPVGTVHPDAVLPTQVAALVITNDVSARDVQLPKTQFYEAKSYPTFTPVGPVLLLLDDADRHGFADLRLQLSVNGELRQDSTVADMIYKPVEALRTLSRFQRLDPGDLILTGTPGGTALKAPPKVVEIIGSLLPPPVKWKAFFKRQQANPRYLQDGDVLDVHVSSPSGDLDLGRQTNTVRYATG